MRRRRPLLVALLILGSAAALALAALGATARRDPAFYAAASQSGDWDTRERSGRFVTRVMELQNDIRARDEWGDTITAADLNAFFIENFGPKGRLTDALPKGFHSPRVAIEGDRLFLGARYGEGFWSTVVWLELRVWLVADQTNVAAVEVCHMKAGALPVGSQSILDRIAETARDSSIEVTWYRHGSNPVGLFRFFAKQPRPTSQVMTLEVRDGKIVVAGKSFLDAGPAVPAGVTPVPPGP
jgi:hypothetical protein